jgi:hypothetical protein
VVSARDEQAEDHQWPALTFIKRKKERKETQGLWVGWVGSKKCSKRYTHIQLLQLTLVQHQRVLNQMHWCHSLGSLCWGVSPTARWEESLLVDIFPATRCLW